MILLRCRQGINPRAAAIHVAHRYHGVRSQPVGRSRWVRVSAGAVGNAPAVDASRILRECALLFECGQGFVKEDDAGKGHAALRFPAKVLSEFVLGHGSDQGAQQHDQLAHPA